MQVSTLSFTVVHEALELKYNQKILGFLFTNICLFLWIYLFILLFENFSISKNNIIRAEAAKVLHNSIRKLCLT
jgi:hypothetical protein